VLVVKDAGGTAWVWRYCPASDIWAARVVEVARQVECGIFDGDLSEKGRELVIFAIDFRNSHVEAIKWQQKN